MKQDRPISNELNLQKSIDPSAAQLNDKRSSERTQGLKVLCKIIEVETFFFLMEHFQSESSPTQ